jgi:hypothetical protein
VFVLLVATAGCARLDSGPGSDRAVQSNQAGSPAEKEATMRNVIADGRTVIANDDHLSDAEVRFLDQALRRSRTDYTEQGFSTFREWELVVTIEAAAESYLLAVFPSTGRVNAEWTLKVEKATGQVSMESLFTLEPPPEQATSPLTSANFVAVRDFVLRCGDRLTYGNKYNHNPHYSFAGFDVFLDPEVGQANINCDPSRSGFDELVIRTTAHGATRYYRVELVANPAGGFALSFPAEDRGELEQYFETMRRRTGGGCE